MSDFWHALLDAIEHLFGKVGAATLLASAAFLWLPANWLSTIGISSNEPALRRIAGIALLCSAAACVVSLSIKTMPMIREKMESFEAHREFNAIPLESRVLLGMAAQFASTTFYAPASLQAVQDLIDRGYFDATTVQSDMRAFVRVEGSKLIAANRAELRKTAADNPEIVRSIAAEILDANQRAQERNRLGWLLG